MFTFEDFSHWLVRDRSGRLSLNDRPYLIGVHRALEERRRIVLACARQVEKTTTLLKLLLYQCMRRPDTRVLYSMARYEQLIRLNRSRFWPMVTNSPFVNKILLDPRRKQRIRHIIFCNGSEVYFEAVGKSADAVRGLSVGLWIGDEAQDYLPDTVPVVEECQSHDAHPKTVISGTSKLADNELEVLFQKSTRNLWHIPCAGCGQLCACDETAMSPSGLECPVCHRSIDSNAGKWIPQNPGARYAEGFRINQLMCPAMDYATILEKKDSYDEFAFRNEVLGEPVCLGELVFDLNRLLECCDENRPLASGIGDIPAHLRGRMVCGVDYGGSAHATSVLCIGALDDNYDFQVYYWHRIPAGRESHALIREIRDVCRRFAIDVVAPDGNGHGHTLNDMLLVALDGPQPPRLVSVHYQDGLNPSYQPLTHYRAKLLLPKTPAIGTLLARVMNRRIVFPCKSDSMEYFFDIASEVCEFDSETHRVHYYKSPTRPDDALHALVMAVSVAQQHFGGRAV